MKISLIAAIDENRGLGAGNRLLWHLPDDFKWFKEHTVGKPLIMGRNTMLSIGKPLPKRTNIVISSSPDNIPEGFIHAYSIQEALEQLSGDHEEVMVIGGGQIYRQMLPMADVLYITKLHHTFSDMDTFFPEWSEEEWEETYHTEHSKDEKHLYGFGFHIYIRKPGSKVKV